MLKLIHLVLQACAILFIGLTACSDSNLSNKDELGIDSTLTAKSKTLIESGNALYLEHCKACHGDPQSSIDGPNLFDRLFERLPAPATGYFLQFVGDSDSLEHSKDAYYLHLKKTYSMINVRHSFKEIMTLNELKAVLAYVMYQNNEGAHAF